MPPQQSSVTSAREYAGKLGQNQRQQQQMQQQRQMQMQQVQQMQQMPQLQERQARPGLADEEWKKNDMLSFEVAQMDTEELSEFVDSHTFDRFANLDVLYDSGDDDSTRRDDPRSRESPLHNPF